LKSESNSKKIFFSVKKTKKYDVAGLRLGPIEGQNPDTGFWGNARNFALDGTRAYGRDTGFGKGKQFSAPFSFHCR
jgi:hypothetical protein